MTKAHWKSWKETGKHRKWKVRNKSGVLVYGDLTEKIIGFCYEMHAKYGSGQKESVYQNALEEKLSANNIPFKKEVPITIKSQDSGKKLGSHRLDFVLDEKVVIETKAIKFTPAKIEQQIFSYLRNSPYKQVCKLRLRTQFTSFAYKVGLMINFGSQKLYVRRVVLS